MKGVIDSLVAGSMTGCLIRACTCPLDVLKIRLQLQLEPIHQSAVSSKYRGLLDAARTMLKEEGIFVFWKGHIPGQMLYIVYTGVQFFTFDVCQRLAMEHFPNGAKWKKSSKFVFGTIAGTSATAVAHPLDVLRTRLAGQGEPKLYPSLPQAVRMMYQENGIRCFYRGLAPSILYTGPQAGLSFGFYYSFILLWNSILGQEQGPQPLITRSFVCGAMAGISSKTIMLPFDLMKKRLEVQGFERARIKFGEVRYYGGLLDCVMKVWREEGLLGFYKGAAISIFKASMSVSLSFMFYEKILYLLQTRHASVS